MSTGDPRDYRGYTVADITTTTGSGYYYDANSPNPNDWRYMYTPFTYFPTVEEMNKYNKKGDDNMRYLYEVILVNPKDENFEIFEIVAKTEISALMQAYEMSDFAGNEELELEQVEFDDLKTQCRVLMEWKKEKSLEKALETIKKAIE